MARVMITGLGCDCSYCLPYLNMIVDANKVEKANGLESAFYYHGDDGGVIIVSEIKPVGNILNS